MFITLSVADIDCGLNFASAHWFQEPIVLKWRQNQHQWENRQWKIQHPMPTISDKIQRCNISNVAFYLRRKKKINFKFDVTCLIALYEKF